jgi:hypothetical protein
MQARCTSQKGGPPRSGFKQSSVKTSCGLGHHPPRELRISRPASARRKNRPESIILHIASRVQKPNPRPAAPPLRLMTKLLSRLCEWSAKRGRSGPGKNERRQTDPQKETDMRIFTKIRTTLLIAAALSFLPSVSGSPSPRRAKEEPPRSVLGKQRNRNKNKNDKQPPPPIVAPNSPVNGGPVRHEAILTWKASIDVVDGYNIYRSDAGGGPYTLINTRLCESLVFSDHTVQAGHTYFYIVTAQRSGAESVNSNEVSVTIPQT